MKPINYSIIATLFLFGLVFASISLVNHYHFRTYAFDLGIFNQAAYHYSQFELNTNTVLNPRIENLLSDHMCLILIPISFSRHLFGTYGLLVMQILFVLFGGLGCYKLFKYKGSGEGIAVLSMVHFFSFIGIYSAFSFDYHNNVIAASLVPWFFYAFYKRNYQQATLYALLIISCKENMALYLSCITLGLLITQKQFNKEKWIFLSALTIFGFIYFYLVVGYVMPAIDNDGRAYNHFNYAVLGNSWGEGIKNLISEPLYYLKLLFQSHHIDPYFNNLKLTFYSVLLLSGGFFALFNPRYLVVTFFILIQKMFNDSPSKWGLAAQYSVVLTPIITISLFEAIQKLNAKKVRYIVSSIATLLCFSTTIYCIEFIDINFINKNRLMFYKSYRYQSKYNNQLIFKELSKIPEKSGVSASLSLVPHLALRDEIHLFPDTANTEYVIILQSDPTSYPLSNEDQQQKIEELKTDANWNIEFESADLLIFNK